MTRFLLWLSTNIELRKLATLSAALAISAVTVATFLAVDPSGADLAELFRYPIQLNIYGLVGSVVATAIAFPLAWLLRRIGWRAEISLRWVWFLTSVTPLLSAGISVLIGLVGILSGPPASTQEMAVHTQALPLIGPDALWLIAIGACWETWALLNLFEVIRTRQRSTGEIEAMLKSSDFRLIATRNSFGQTQPEDGVTAYVLSVKEEGKDTCTRYGLTQQNMRKLYSQCARTLDLDLSKLPALAISSSERTRLSGPYYVRDTSQGPLIVMPDDLDHYVQESLSAARDQEDAQGNESRFNPKVWILRSISALLFHELGHHIQREHRVDLLLNTTKALFPLPWCILLSLPRGPLARLHVAREHACDALAVQYSRLSPRFMAAAVDCMHEAVRRAQGNFANKLRRQLQILTAEQMVGDHSQQLTQRIQLLHQIPSQLHRGRAIVPLIITLSVAFLFAPKPAWRFVSRMPDTIPFREGLPHVQVQQIVVEHGLSNSWYGDDSYRSWQRDRQMQEEMNRQRRWAEERRWQDHEKMRQMDNITRINNQVNSPMNTFPNATGKPNTPGHIGVPAGSPTSPFGRSPIGNPGGASRFVGPHKNVTNPLGNHSHTPPHRAPYGAQGDVYRPPATYRPPSHSHSPGGFSPAGSPW